MNEYLILVDENDIPQGKQEKLLAHQLGLLHRAFSVFIFNTNGELLMQQRASEKYHSAGLWTNTCCSHPKFDEHTIDAVKRRLKQEMGIKCETKFAFSFMYKATFENGLIEHEYDHVYFGISDSLPIPDRSEVQNWRYVSLKELQTNVSKHPEQYSEWFKICLPKVIDQFSYLFVKNSMLYYE